MFPQLNPKAAYSSALLLPHYCSAMSLSVPTAIPHGSPEYCTREKQTFILSFSKCHSLSQCRVPACLPSDCADAHQHPTATAGHHCSYQLPTPASQLLLPASQPATDCCFITPSLALCQLVFHYCHLLLPSTAATHYCYQLLLPARCYCWPPWHYCQPAIHSCQPANHLLLPASQPSATAWHYCQPASQVLLPAGPQDALCDVVQPGCLPPEGLPLGQGHHHHPPPTC